MDERPLSAARIPRAIAAASLGCAAEMQLTAIEPASGRRLAEDPASAGAPRAVAPSAVAP